MSLEPDQPLSPCRPIEKIGERGMGVVKAAAAVVALTLLAGIVGTTSGCARAPRDEAKEIKSPQQAHKKGEGLVAGPWLQHTTDTTANVWFQLESAGNVTVTVNESNFHKEVSDYPYAGHVVVTGLAAGNSYTYSVSVDGNPTGISRRFTTMPLGGAPGKFHMIGIADHHLGAMDTHTKKITIENYYKQLLELIDDLNDEPVICVIHGDFEIAGDHDANSDSNPARQQAISALRARSFPEAYANQFHGRVPTYCVWDDWDFLGNNSAGKNETEAARAVAAETHRDFWSGQPFAVGDAIYSSFLVADCPIILLDTRFERAGTPTSQPQVDSWDYLAANPALGSAQLAWLEKELDDAAAAPYKFVFAGDNLLDPINRMATPAFKGRRDSIGIYHRTERNKLLSHLSANPSSAKGLVYFKGDDHVAAVHVCDEWRPQEPIADVDHTAYPSIKPAPAVEITQISSSFYSTSTRLFNPWKGRDDEKFAAVRASFWHVTVDSSQPRPRADYDLVSFEGDGVLYSFHGIDGQLIFPSSEYHSVAGAPFAEPSADGAEGTTR
jgi:hypothetical protein